MTLRAAFHERYTGVLWVAVGVFLMSSAPSAEAQTSAEEAQTRLGGHFGFVLPLVTHAGGKTTNLADNFSIGFPLGITFKGRGRIAYDLELVPGVQDTPRRSTLTVHPGLVWAVGRDFGVGMRAAFDVNTPVWGF